MLKPYHTRGRIEAGCDEAGRGCLAGPVFAAAVILPKGFIHPLLNDSKKLTSRQRESLRKTIENEAISWKVSMIDNETIDRINILNASILAMQRAVDQLDVRPEMLLIDGNRFHAYPDVPHHCIIRGDGIYASIAAASILAKTHRDEFMLRIHLKYPSYGWDTNKGYPTLKHRQAIQAYGITEYHRRSFSLGGQMSFF